MANERLEIILHQPLLYQGALRERTPDFFRGIRYLPFDDKGTGGVWFNH
jgi:hypothetical protein